MKKKFIFLISIFALILFMNIKVEALTYGGCEYSQISRLKSLVSNINISYDYYIDDGRVYFNIILNNIVPGIYFVDSITDEKYNYYNTVDGEIVLTGYSNTTGNYKFYSDLSECYGVKLGNKYYSLPTYNIYYGDPLCENNRNYSLCKKWLKVSYSRDEFEKLVNEFNSKNDYNAEEDNDSEVVYEKTYLDKFVEFYVDYYYFLLVGIIAICITIMIISRMKNRFDI